MKPNVNLIDPKDYHEAVKKLRNYFEGRGFVEVHTQSRLSILAACEDPNTIATYSYAGSLWPLPQTGQMWLEYEMLNHPEYPGTFCISTSFRNEPDPIPGRHDLIFPMFEFETKGGMKILQELEIGLLEALGFGGRDSFNEGNYVDIAHEFGTKKIEAEHETRIGEKYGSVFFLKNFPLHTHPFWNMKKVGDYANKIDVIIYGVETIGSAERSTSTDEMRELFHTISDGMYANILYSQFGKERVEEELEDFLSLDLFPRCGGGIGMTRMIRALKLLNK